MKNLHLYTSEICSQLRQIAEQRDWRAGLKSVQRDELLEELELTYHLHMAAEATGRLAGVPAMLDLPATLVDSEGLLDPAEFISSYSKRDANTQALNQSDNHGLPMRLMAWVLGAVLAAHMA